MVERLLVDPVATLIVEKGEVDAEAIRAALAQLPKVTEWLDEVSLDPTFDAALFTAVAALEDIGGLILDALKLAHERKTNA